MAAGTDAWWEENTGQRQQTNRKQALVLMQYTAAEMVVANTADLHATKTALQSKAPLRALEQIQCKEPDAGKSSDCSSFTGM